MPRKAIAGNRQPPLRLRHAVVDSESRSVDTALLRHYYDGLTSERWYYVTMLVLKDTAPEAEGLRRFVFRHPNDAKLLVKVGKPEWFEAKLNSGRPWYKPRRRRYQELLGHLQEVREHLAVRARLQAHPLFVQRIVGFEDTDYGLGLVVEAVLAPDQGLAPTLTQLVDAERFNAAKSAALDDFCEAVVESDLIVTDLSMDNIVYGATDETGPRFVLVDGVGFKRLISAERISRTWNRRVKSQRVARMRRDIATRPQDLARELEDEAEGRAAATRKGSYSREYRRAARNRFRDAAIG